VSVYNEHAKACQTYSGVPLMDLLKLLGVPDKPHGKDLRFYLVAEGADGYQAVYSVAEVNPDVHDATVIVADALEGKGLADSGPLQLIASGEKLPARWVRIWWPSGYWQCSRNAPVERTEEFFKRVSSMSSKPRLPTAGAKQAAEKGPNSTGIPDKHTAGLKPVLILRHLRHD